MDAPTATMRIGVALPQEATRADPIAVRDFAQAVEQIGFTHLEVYDHVLGASRKTYPDLLGPYRLEHSFYEPFVLFGYLAGQTQTLELVTGVIILSQRQTALVAKQAAIVDVLSGGRLRLGIGTGWNPVEFEALGENFHDRGRRSEEQIAVLRALWTQEAVTFQGHWHTILDAGINPLPVQRPIPIWIGGRAEAVAERSGRLGDGWIMLHYPPDDQARAHVETMRTAARQARRGPDSVGLEVWISLGDQAPDDWVAETEAWHRLGMTHLTVNTEFTSGRHRATKAKTMKEHIALLEQYRAVIGDLNGHTA
ncbi:MAG: LLM class F420-dependent oxidoreductase [Thermomicrobiales bacterium]